MSKLKPLVCPQCGGKVNRDTYKCEYCGTQFKNEYEYEPVRLDIVEPGTHVLGAQAALTYDLIDAMGSREASEYVLRQMAKEMAEQLIPLMDVKVVHDYVHQCKAVRARLRVVEPTFRF